MKRHSLQLNKKQGFVLILTLMVLVLLASLVVNFQADATIHVRASTFRQDYVQCRYAAESGMIAGKLLVNELINDKKALTTIKPGSGKKKLNLNIDPNELDDPNNIGDLIAKILADPNELVPQEDPLEEKGQQKLDLLLKEKTIQVGKAEVLIQIFDETGKLPMIWLAQSPYRNVQKPEFLKNLGSYLGVPAKTSRLAKQVADDIAGPLNIPVPDYVITGPKNLSSRRNPQGELGYTDALRETYQQGIERRKKRYDSMAAFAEMWNQEVQPDTDNELLLVPLEDHPGTFVDYLGTWGHDKININTAPVEVIEAALKPIGVTHQMAEMIVTMREEKPIGHPSVLKDVDEFKQMAKALFVVAITHSNTFTIRVTATLGRTKYKMFSAVYKSPDEKSGIKTQAIYAGE